MDKELLRQIVMQIRHVTDDVAHVNEMAWRIYTAGVRLFPDRFASEYQLAQGVSFDEMLRKRDEQLRLLDEIIRALEQ